MNKPEENRTKWAIRTDTQFVSGNDGKIAWTYDKKEAETFAEIVGGRVVDAEKLSVLGKESECEDA